MAARLKFWRHEQEQTRFTKGFMNDRPVRGCREGLPLPIEDVARGVVVLIECSSDRAYFIEPIPVVRSNRGWSARPL